MPPWGYSTSVFFVSFFCFVFVCFSDVENSIIPQGLLLGDHSKYLDLFDRIFVAEAVMHKVMTLLTPGPRE